VYRDSVTIIRPLAPRSVVKRPCSPGWVRRQRTEPQLPSTMVAVPSYTLEASPPVEEAPASIPPPQASRRPVQMSTMPLTPVKLVRPRPNQRLATLLVVLSLVEAFALVMLLLRR
jgi:hypothetical protein